MAAHRLCAYRPICCQLAPNPGPADRKRTKAGGGDCAGISTGLLFRRLVAPAHDTAVETLLVAGRTGALQERWPSG